MTDAVARPTARLSTRTIPGPVGGLEAILREPERAAGAAVVAHPHPLHGGTMHTKVVHRAAKLLSERFGLAALRFNFRGVGASEGLHDGGRGETDDLRAAARWVRAAVPNGPFVLGGFSFGSLCAIRAAAELSPDVLFLMGVPLDRWSGEDADRVDASRVVWVQGGDDAFAPGDKARAFALARGWDLTVVPGADHFFAGRLDEFEASAAAGIGRRLDGTRA